MYATTINIDISKDGVINIDISKDGAINIDIYKDEAINIKDEAEKIRGKSENFLETESHF